MVKKNKYAGWYNEEIYKEIIRNLDDMIDILDDMSSEDFRSSSEDDECMSTDEHSEDGAET